MLVIGICDNQVDYRNKIENLIKSSLSVKKNYAYKIEHYDSALSLLSRKNKIEELDAIYLEVDLEDMNGIKLAEQIRLIKEDILIIFVTKNLIYAIEGYKVKALRFIVKDELEEEITDSLDAILGEKNLHTKMVHYNFTNGQKELCVNEISYIESDKHKVIFNCKKRKKESYILYEKLDKIQENFYGLDFIRIHKSYLVNLDYIKGFLNYRVELKDNLVLPVAKTRYAAMKEEYIKYKLNKK